LIPLLWNRLQRRTPNLGDVAMHKGSCLCGAVTFAAAGELSGPDACHCGNCRKHSGHVFASTDVAKSALSVEGEANVRWYASSDKARRGFCVVCGSSLFWDPLFPADWIGIAMGAFDTPTDTTLAVHIFVADKGDYYEIADEVAQFEGAPKAPH
jgi:hypothetical protein